jgi:hypothetical protein
VEHRVGQGEVRSDAGLARATALFDLLGAVAPEHNVDRRGDEEHRQGSGRHEFALSLESEPRRREDRDLQRLLSAVDPVG